MTTGSARMTRQQRRAPTRGREPPPSVGAVRKTGVVVVQRKKAGCPRRDINVAIRPSVLSQRPRTTPFADGRDLDCRLLGKDSACQSVARRTATSSGALLRTARCLLSALRRAAGGSTRRPGGHPSRRRRRCNGTVERQPSPPPVFLRGAWLVRRRVAPCLRLHLYELARAIDRSRAVGRFRVSNTTVSTAAPTAGAESDASWPATSQAPGTNEDGTANCADGYDDNDDASTIDDTGARRRGRALVLLAFALQHARATRSLPIVQSRYDLR